MPVLVEDFLEQYKHMSTTERLKEAWVNIRKELYSRNHLKSKCVPNDVCAKSILVGRYDCPGDYPLSKWFRDYARNNTEFIGNGGFPI